MFRQVFSLNRAESAQLDLQRYEKPLPRPLPLSLSQEFLSKMKPCCGRSDGIFLFHSGIYSLVAPVLTRIPAMGVMWQGRRSVFVYDRKGSAWGSEINIPYPVLKPFPDYDLHIISQQYRRSLS